MLANRLCVQGAASTRTSPRFAISTLAGRVPGPSGGRAFGVAGGVALGVLGLPPRCEKSDGMDGMGVLQSARTCENSWAGRGLPAPPVRVGGSTLPTPLCGSTPRRVWQSGYFR